MLNSPGHLPPRREEKREKQQGTSKGCRRCGQTKSAEQFPGNRRVSDGLSSWCRACHALAKREHRARKRSEGERTEREGIRRNAAEIAQTKWSGIQVLPHC